MVAIEINGIRKELPVGELPLFYERRVPFHEGDQAQDQLMLYDHDVRHIFHGYLLILYD